MISTVRRLAGSVATAILLSVAWPAAAGTIYDLNATATNQAQMGNFQIRFDDTSGDGLLQLGEITSFSGVTFFVTLETFNTVACVPNIVAVATGVCSDNQWRMTNATTTLFAPIGVWQYSITPVSAVPLPPALLLFASALGMIGFFRWWKDCHRAGAECQ